MSGLPQPPKNPAPTLAGSRLLGLTVGGLVLMESPTATLATQAVLAALISNSAGYCGTQLLAEPLSQQRMRALAYVLECATMPAALLLQPLLLGVIFNSGAPILHGG